MRTTNPVFPSQAPKSAFLRLAGIALLVLTINQLGRFRAAADTTLFFDDFSGPTLSSSWQASLPTMNQENAVFGPRPATYVGAPVYSFQTFGGASVIRMTETNSALTRRGWSTSTSFTGTG